MGKIKWDFHRFDTKFLIDNLDAYIQETERHFEELQKNARKSIPDIPRDDSDDDYSYWRNEVNIYEERYEKDFPSKIRYSFVVLLHIIFETRLHAACNEIAKRNNIDLKENDLRGGPIERARNYLTKKANVKISNQIAWQVMTDHQKIRDCIVHTNGDISKSKDKNRILEIGKKGIGIVIDHDELYIEADYFKFTLETLRQFFDDIYETAGFGPAVPVLP